MEKASHRVGCRETPSTKWPGLGSMSAYLRTLTIVAALALCLSADEVSTPQNIQGGPALTAGPWTFGVFTARFQSDGTLTMEGQGWPTLKGTWKMSDAVLELSMPGQPLQCTQTGRYRVSLDGTRFTLEAESDECKMRRLFFDRSTWRPV